MFAAKAGGTKMTIEMEMEMERLDSTISRRKWSQIDDNAIVGCLSSLGSLQRINSPSVVYAFDIQADRWHVVVRAQFHVLV